MQRTGTGFSLIEMMLVVALIGVIFSAILPYFSALNTTWTAFQLHSDNLQNARIALDYFQRECKQASRIILISDSSNSLGSLTFEKPDGTQRHFLADTSGSDTLFSLEESGIYYPIAGPIDSLYFTGYDESGSETTLNALVKSIKMDMTCDAYTYSSLVTCPKDSIESLYFSVFGQTISLTGSGTIDGDVHANGTITTTGGSIVVSGETTDWTLTNTIDIPTVSISTICEPYTDLSVYESAADTIVTSDFTFLQNNVYTGIYYLSNGSSATIEKNVDIIGSIIAEGDVIIDGQHVNITPSGSNPAVVAGNDILIISFQDQALTTTGALYANRDFITNGRTVLVTGNGPDHLAIGAGRDIISTSHSPTVSGNMVAIENISFSKFKTITLSSDNQYLCLTAGGDITFDSTGDVANITGLIYSGGSITCDHNTLTMTGSIIASNNITLNTAVTLTYDSSHLHTPPTRMWEEL